MLKTLSPDDLRAMSVANEIDLRVQATKASLLKRRQVISRLNAAWALYILTGWTGRY